MSHQTTTFLQTYQIQFSFHFDVIQRLLDLARQIPEEAYHAPWPYSRGSMHQTFAHLLGADLFWRSVLLDQPPVDLEPEDIPGLDGIAAMLEKERAGWLELLDSYDTETLMGTTQRQSPYGLVEFSIWKILQHVILHGIQHQTELAHMLTEAGQSPGDLDFDIYQPGG